MRAVHHHRIVTKTLVVSASTAMIAMFVQACSEHGPAAPTPVGNALGTPSPAQVDGQGPGNSPLAATIQFGQDVGSPFPPDSGHDQSGHAADKLVPRTVVIANGGTVTFNVPPNVHQIAIYEPGTEPEDIDTSALTTLAAFAGCAGDPVVNAPLVIDDATNRVAAYPIPCFAPAQQTHTFTSPGRYLVICAFLPHFEEAQMYGWVIVRE